MNKKNIILCSLIGVLAIGCVVYAPNNMKINNQIYDGLKYSTKASILLQDEDNELTNEIAKQDRYIERDLYDKIPDTAIKNTDEIFNKMSMNSGRYFEKIDEETNNELLDSKDLKETVEVYDRKISDDEAIKIAMEELSNVLSKQQPEKTTAEFVLYTNLYENIEQRPIVLVTFDGVAMGTPQAMKNPQKINQTQVYIDSLTGDILEITSRSHN